MLKIEELAGRYITSLASDGKRKARIFAAIEIDLAGAHKTSFSVYVGERTYVVHSLPDAVRLFNEEDLDDILNIDQEDKGSIQDYGLEAVLELVA